MHPPRRIKKYKWILKLMIKKKLINFMINKIIVIIQIILKLRWAIICHLLRFYKKRRATHRQPTHALSLILLLISFFSLSLLKIIRNISKVNRSHNSFPNYHKWWISMRNFLMTHRKTLSSLSERFNRINMA